MKRNQRDRTEIAKNEGLLNNLYFLPDDIILHQLLDRIHAYYLHSFDIGYKLTNEQRNNIINQDVEVKLNEDIIGNDITALQINSLIKSKKNHYQNIDGLNRLNNANNKFVTDHVTDEKTNNLDEYSYGFRFFYWKLSQRHQLQAKWIIMVKPTFGVFPDNINNFNWYVSNKYQDLKEELTNNEICVIGRIQLEQSIKKALIYMKSNKVKQIFCRRQKSAICYEMYPKQLISVHHLISLMVYCNYDQLQRRFSETFRKLDKDETNDALKARHQNYYFMARFLTECAECFGMQTIKPWTEITVFHGIDKPISFSSMDACIKGPFSATTQYDVTKNFCNNQGIILEMAIDTDWSIPLWESKEGFKTMTCVDMHWVSDFPNEQEIFCIGGLSRFKFKSIITALGINYVGYIGGLRTLTHNTSVEKTGAGDFINFSQSKLMTQIAYRLLSDELYRYKPDHPDAHEFKGCPDYIRNILHSHCENVFAIQMVKTDAIINYFFKNKFSEWIKFDLITMVYPKLQKIEYIAWDKDGDWLTHHSIYKSVLEFIARNKMSVLSEISIQYHFKYHDEVAQCINKYKQNFAYHSWCIQTIVADFNRPEFPDWQLAKNVGSHLNIEQILQHERIKEVQNKFGLDETFHRAVLLNPDKMNQSSICIRKLKCK
eukprot:16083_1